MCGCGVRYHQHSSLYGVVRPVLAVAHEGVRVGVFPPVPRDGLVNHHLEMKGKGGVGRVCVHVYMRACVCTYMCVCVCV